MSKLSRYNSGYKYLLVCVDVFSRYMAITPLKNKSATSATEGFKKILAGPAFKGVKYIFSDRGPEFKNNILQRYFKDKQIKWYSSFSVEVKCGLVERHIRTIKTLIYKSLSLYKTNNYISKLDILLKKYNNSQHRGLLGNTPHSVHFEFDRSQIIDLYRAMYLNRPYKKRGSLPKYHNLSVGDCVRVASAKRQNPFSKGYTLANTPEIFRVNSINRDQSIPTYFLKDLSGENITGAFYREELIKVVQPTLLDFKILKTEKLPSGDRLYKVTFNDFSSDFVGYVRKSQIEKYAKQSHPISH